MKDLEGPYLAPCAGVTCRLCAPPASAERQDAHVLDLSLRDVSGWAVVEVYLDGTPLATGASFPGQSHLLQGHATPLRFVSGRRRSAIRSGTNHIARLVREARQLSEAVDAREAMRERHQAVRLGLEELADSGAPLA